MLYVYNVNKSHLIIYLFPLGLFWFQGVIFNIESFFIVLVSIIMFVSILYSCVFILIVFFNHEVSNLYKNANNNKDLENVNYKIYSLISGRKIK